jgi:hypothetical protein
MCIVCTALFFNPEASIADCTNAVVATVVSLLDNSGVVKESFSPVTAPFAISSVVIAAVAILALVTAKDAILSDVIAELCIFIVLTELSETIAFPEGPVGPVAP